MPDSSGQFSVSSRSVAIGTTCFSIVSLTALAIVATIREVDSLSVIALALATLAFVIQIILYVVQSNSATQQSIRSEEIYGATLKALAAIEEKTEGTRQAVTGSSERMIEALIGKFIPEAESAGVRLDSTQFSEKLAERIAVSLDARDGADAADSSGNRVSLSASSSARRIRRPAEPSESPFAERDRIRKEHAQLLDRFPAGDAAIANCVSIMSTLDDEALEDLARLVNDEQRYGPPAVDQTSGGLQYLSSADILTEKGLVRRIRVKWGSTSAVFILSDLGRLAGRILASPSVPDSAPDGVVQLRARLTAMQREMYNVREQIRLERDSRIPIEEL